MTVLPGLLVFGRPKIKDMKRMKTTIFKNMLPKGPDPRDTREEQLHATKSHSFIIPTPFEGVRAITVFTPQSFFLLGLKSES